jgi:hypothetical protein
MGEELARRKSFMQIDPSWSFPSWTDLRNTMS